MGGKWWMWVVLCRFMKCRWWLVSRERVGSLCLRLMKRMNMVNVKMIQHVG